MPTPTGTLDTSFKGNVTTGGIMGGVTGAPPESFLEQPDNIVIKKIIPDMKIRFSLIMF